MSEKQAIDALRDLLKAFRVCVGSGVFAEWEHGNPAVRAAIALTTPTMEQLAAAQHVHFPGSRMLSRAEVMDRWLLMGTSAVAIGAIASALLKYPTILFYETKNGSRGARYGVEGHEYLSGAFGGRP